ncbi:unnamed protein product [Staurois parvus]|uniref:Growth hormone receptor n=1 Tax=Staurois parvus TaxID=386267 RepID=A0ABN9H0R2_9NEOB|nr:unnamed protein product [Staurois parvus]
MEDQTKQGLADPMCLEVESNQYMGNRGRHQVDFLEEMADPGDISLDSLIFQRPEDGISYQKRGGGPASSDNNELENVLDSILDTSASSHLHPWADYVIPEFQEISVTSAALTKTLGDHTADKEEVGVWTGATAAENKSIPSLVPKEQDKATLEYTIENQLEGKGRSHGLLASRHPPMPPVGSAVYLPAHSRHIEDNDDCDQKSSPCSSQHLSPYPCHSSSHHDGKVKQEDTLYPDYGIPSSSPTAPGPDCSLEYICKTETTAAYENFRSTLGKSCDNTTPVLPTSSTSSQKPLPAPEPQCPSANFLPIRNCKKCLRTPNSSIL